MDSDDDDGPDAKSNNSRGATKRRKAILDDDEDDSDDKSEAANPAGSGDQLKGIDKGKEEDAAVIGNKKRTASFSEDSNAKFSSGDEKGGEKEFGDDGGDDDGGPVDTSKRKRSASFSEDSNVQFSSGKEEDEDDDEGPVVVKKPVKRQKKKKSTMFDDDDDDDSDDPVVKESRKGKGASDEPGGDKKGGVEDDGDVLQDTQEQQIDDDSDSSGPHLAIGEAASTDNDEEDSLPRRRRRREVEYDDYERYGDSSGMEEEEEDRFFDDEAEEDNDEYYEEDYEEVEPEEDYPEDDYYGAEEEQASEEISDDASGEEAASFRVLNAHDTDIITLAMFQEIWHHYRQRTQPHLLLEGQLNTTACRFLMHQLSTLQEQDPKESDEDGEWDTAVPTKLTLKSCTFCRRRDPSASDSDTDKKENKDGEEEGRDKTDKENHAAQLLADFLRQNQDNWSAITFDSLARGRSATTSGGGKSAISHRRMTHVTDKLAMYMPVFQALPDLHALDSLEFSEMYLFGAQFGTCLRAYLSSATTRCNLSTLKLCHCQIDMNVWDELNEGLRDYSNLWSLQIRDCRFLTTTGAEVEQNNSANHLLEALQVLITVGLSQSGSCLKSLELSRSMRKRPIGGWWNRSYYSSPLDAEALPVLTTMLNQLSGLERLNLSHHSGLFNRKDDNDHEQQQQVRESFVDALVNHGSAKIVDLQSCAMDDLVGSMMFQALENNRQTCLLWLNLRKNTFDGSLPINYIANFKSLVKLYLPERDEASRREFSQALRLNTLLVDCRCCRGDGRHRRMVPIFRRNRMIRQVKESMLSLPISLWPRVFAIMPERDDPTALYVALQTAHPGLTGGDSERLLRAAKQAPVAPLMDLPDGWETDGGNAEDDDNEED